MPGGGVEVIPGATPRIQRAYDSSWLGGMVHVGRAPTQNESGLYAAVVGQGQVTSTVCIVLGEFPVCSAAAVGECCPAVS
jgi:hypothetical protein